MGICVEEKWMRGDLSKDKDDLIMFRIHTCPYLWLGE